jgi:serine/threonine-protein kinase
LDYGVDDKLPFIVMELLDGENLAQRLRRIARLPPADTARIITHIGRAVGRAHEAGIVHRDLKPENVFLIRNEDEEIAKVLDFGVAKVSVGALGHVGEEGTRTRTGSILGTPYYMSPEQAQGNKTVDARSDLWSLGVIAFECLTGKRPFYSDGLGDLVLQICIREIPVPSEVGSVPLGFDAWFARAVARDPDARFQSARELTDALREVLGGEARDLHWTAPEVSVTSRDEAPNSQARTRVDAPADFAAPTLAAESNSSIRLTSGTLPADQHAATLAAPSEGPISTRGEVPSSPKSSRPNSAVIAELLANAESEPPRKRSGAGLVLAVAGTALAIGLAAGFVFMKREHDPKLRPLPSAVPPAHEIAAPHVRAKPPDHAPSAREEPAPFTSASAKAANSGHPAVGASAAIKPMVSSAASAVSAPDAGWVKPAWAIPDDEPRRVHDDAQPARDAGK